MQRNLQTAKSEESAPHNVRELFPNYTLVGLVGFSGASFDASRGKDLVLDAFELVRSKFATKKFVLISGLTNVGIPAIGYEIASNWKWKTVGIACPLANSYQKFKVDLEIIVGTNWGDESPLFLDSIDLLIRVGGGAQALKETAQAKARGIPCIEFDLAKL